MNIKKIGLTALAGSLVATSAMAGSLTLSGGAKLSYTTHSGTEAPGSVASAYAMDQEITATGSGELDNGFVVTLTHGMSGEETAKSDTSSLTLDMGDMGTISYSDADNHAGLAGLEDFMPKAYEQANDGIKGSPVMAQQPSGQGFGYDVNAGGAKISIGFSDGIAAAADRTDGEQDNTASANSSSSVALTYAVADTGLEVRAGIGEEGQADGKHIDHSTVGATYAYGPVKVGYQINDEEDSDSSASNTDLETEIYAVSFMVNDNLSISYGEHNTEKEGSATDQEISSVQASYSMGGMTINLKDSEGTGIQNDAAKTADTTEVLITFAF